MTSPGRSHDSQVDVGPDKTEVAGGPPHDRRAFLAAVAGAGAGAAVALAAPAAVLASAPGIGVFTTKSSTPAVRATSTGAGEAVFARKDTDAGGNTMLVGRGGSGEGNALW